MDWEIDFMLGDELENLWITLFQAHIERVFIVKLEFVEVVK